MFDDDDGAHVTLVNPYLNPQPPALMIVALDGNWPSVSCEMDFGVEVMKRGKASREGLARAKGVGPG